MNDANIVFFAIAAFTIVSAAWVFLSRKLMHSVIALTVAFTGSASVFALLGQAEMALLQLFVFVGGLSTYLIVAVAAEESKKEIMLPRFAAMALAASAILIIFSASLGAGQQQAPSFASAAVSAFSSDYPLLAIIALTLFSAAIGSILVLRKHIRLVV